MQLHIHFVVCGRSLIVYFWCLLTYIPSRTRYCSCISPMFSKRRNCAVGGHLSPSDHPKTIELLYSSIKMSSPKIEENAKLWFGVQLEVTCFAHFVLFFSWPPFHACQSKCDNMVFYDLHWCCNRLLSWIQVTQKLLAAEDRKLEVMHNELSEHHGALSGLQRMANE